MGSRVMTFVPLLCLLLISIKSSTGASFNGGGPSNSNEGNRERNGIRGGGGGGYGGPHQPDLPALYSAPKTHQEQDLQDNEVDQQSSTDRDSTTTEIYYEEQDEGTSEDYQFTTGTTQSPIPHSDLALQQHEAVKSSYGVPSQDHQVGGGGYSSGYSDKPHQDNQQVENHPYLQNSHGTQSQSQSQSPASVPNHQNQVGSGYHQQNPVPTLFYGSPSHTSNSLPPQNLFTSQSNFNGGQSQGHEQQQLVNAVSDRKGGPGFEQSQYLPPYQNVNSEKSQTSYNEPPRYVAPRNNENEISVPLRDYIPPSSASPSQINVQNQNSGVPQIQFYTQGVYSHSQQQSSSQDNQERPQVPFSQPQQQYLPSAQPKEENHHQQQPQQQPQQQVHQQAFPTISAHNQNEPQFHGQQPQAPAAQQQQQYLPPAGQSPQQEQRQPSQFQYQQQQQPQQQQPQQPQYATSNSPAAPSKPIENEVQPQTNGNTDFEYEGFSDNDNVVDAELLQRVQRIIEEHERQQKEIQEKFRRENEAKEEFYRNQQHQQEQPTPAFNSNTNGNAIGGEAYGAPVPTINGALPNNNRQLNTEYNSPSAGNSAENRNDNGIQRSQYFPPSRSGTESLNEGQPRHSGEANQNYLNSAYGAPTFPQQGQADQEFNSFRGDNQNGQAGGWTNAGAINSGEEPSRPGYPLPSRSQEEQQFDQGVFGGNAGSHQNYGPPSSSSRYNGQSSEEQWLNPSGSQPPTATPGSLRNSNDLNNDTEHLVRSDNENPTTKSLNRAPHIEYQKAILSDHFVETQTQPGFPASRVGGTGSPRQEYLPSPPSAETSSPSPDSRREHPTFDSGSHIDSFSPTLTSGIATQSHGFPQHSQINNGPRNSNDYFPSNDQSRNENPDLSTYSGIRNELPSQQSQPISYPNPNQHSFQISQPTSQNDYPNTFYGVSTSSAQVHDNGNGNGNGPSAPDSPPQFTAQPQQFYSQPPPSNYYENVQGNQLEGAQPPQHNQQHQQQQSQPQVFPPPATLYPTSFTSNGNSRTIVVHEVPFGSVPGVFNRALITPSDLPTTSPPQEANQEQNHNTQYLIPQSPFLPNNPSDNEINFLYATHGDSVNPTSPYQVSQIGAHQPAPQFLSLAQPQSLSPAAPQLGYNLPNGDNPGAHHEINGANEIPPSSPKPIYGIPLAPALGPESLAPSSAQQQHDSSVVLSSQISFRQSGSSQGNSNVDLEGSRANSAPFYPTHQQQQQPQQEQLQQQFYTQQQQPENNNQYLIQSDGQQESNQNQQGGNSNYGIWSDAGGNGLSSDVSPLPFYSPAGAGAGGQSFINEPTELYGSPNHISSVTYSNSNSPAPTAPVTAEPSPSPRRGRYGRRDRSLKQRRFSSPVRSPLVSAFSVKANEQPKKQ